MSRKLKHHEKEEEPAMNIDSLVDVAFLLLIYFLVTTSLQKLEADLTINPPGPPVESDLPEPPTITIEIAANGDISAVSDGGTPEPLDRGGDDRQVPLLDNKFQLYAGTAADELDQAVVIIRPDPDTSHQRFVDVVNAAAEAQLQNISFANLFDDEDS